MILIKSVLSSCRDVRESQVSLDVRERKAARTTHMVSVERKVTVEPLGQPDLRGRWENREGMDCQVSLELLELL